VADFFDVRFSRSVPWERRPESSRLLAELKRPDRDWSGVVVGEGTRCWYGNQFSLNAPKFAAYGVEVALRRRARAAGGLAGSRRLERGAKRTTKRVYPLHGRVRCGVCERRMEGHRARPVLTTGVRRGRSCRRLRPRSTAQVWPREASHSGEYEVAAASGRDQGGCEPGGAGGCDQ
jgi:hypothetical protein